MAIMTKNKLYIISAILLVIAIALPISISFLKEDALIVIDSISTLIGACCGVITLLIAILLYNKYGIDQSITDKQLKVVFDIVEELKKTVVFALSTSNSGSYFARLNFWTTDISGFGNGPHSYLDYTVYFKISYAHAFSHLYELAQEPFAPKEVSEAIKDFQLYMLSEVKQEHRVERYIIIYANSDENVSYRDVVGKCNDIDMTLRDYIQSYQKVKESIKTWLLGHGVDPKNINF